MRILSIDPGERTGIIIFDSSTESIIKNETLSISRESMIEESIPEGIFLELGSVDVIVMEDKPRYSTWDYSIEMLFLGIVKYSRKLNKTLELVFPGIWKPISKVMGWNIPKSLTSQHEIDAYKLLRYYMMINKIGEPVK